MPKQIQRSKEIDNKIIEMRAMGKIWDVIGHELRLSRSTLQVIAKDLNLSGYATPTDEYAKNRLPLHAGHPNTWGAISKDKFPYYVPNTNLYF